MAAQFLHAHPQHNQPERYTLVLRNGQLLRHQDGLALAQFRSDARLLKVLPEPANAA
jgi:hypothetical protein